MRDSRPLDRDEWRGVIAHPRPVRSRPRCSGRPTSRVATPSCSGPTPTPTAPISLLGFGAEIPTTWFLAFNPFMIFAFTPFVVALWTRQAARGSEPSTVTKMALGCFGVALSYLIMAAAGVAGGRRQGELAVAARLFRRRHHRRTLSVAGRAVAGDQDRAGAHPVDDDGRVAGDEFRRRFPRRLYRQLLEPDGQAGVFPDGRGHRRAGGRAIFSLAAGRCAGCLTD